MPVLKSTAYRDRVEKADRGGSRPSSLFRHPSETACEAHCCRPAHIETAAGPAKPGGQQGVVRCQTIRISTAMAVTTFCGGPILLAARENRWGSPMAAFC